MFGKTIDRLFENYKKDLSAHGVNTIENTFGETHFGKYYDSKKQERK